MLKTILLFLFAIGAAHAQSQCPQFYPHEIDVPNSVELCNTFYAVKYDTARNEPILSAEKFRAGGSVDRSNNFHPDPRLDKSTRAEVSDYLHSGYDQGHLTPAADATTIEEMRDTFLLSNMTPQQPTLNRQAWRLLEIQVRKLNPDYVVTGAIYSDTPQTIGEHKVPVPVGYYKIIWKGGKAQAWGANNYESAPVTETDIKQIEVETGLKFE